MNGELLRAISIALEITQNQAKNGAARQLPRSSALTRK
jgi:hypothetical protein